MCEYSLTHKLILRIMLCKDYNRIFILQEVWLVL